MDASRQLLLLGTTAFNPASISGLFAWWSADYGVYQDSALTTPSVSDGDPVGGWSDRSGNNRHLVQTVVASKPTLKLTQYHGYPSVRFDGVDDYFLRDPFVLAQPFTAAFVVKVGGANQAVFDADGTGPGRVSVFTSSAPNARYVYAFDGVGYPAISDGIFTTSLEVWTVVVNGASSAFYVNGTLETSGDLGTGGQNSITVGNAQGGTGRPLSGDICEGIFYSSALNAATLSGLNGYLRVKWGL